MGTDRCSAFRSRLVTIKVGPKAMSYSVHKDLLCHYSSYFRGALTGGFAEARSHEITLVEEETWIFDIFVNFLYTGRLYEEKPGLDAATRSAVETPETDHSETIASESDTIIEARTFVNLRQSELIRVWVFADRRGVIALQNEAINAYHQHILETGCLEYVGLSYLYDNTVSGAKLRNMFVEFDAIVPNAKPEFARYVDSWPKDYLAELCDRRCILATISPLKLDPQKRWKDLDLCQYHIHEFEDCRGRPVKQKGSAKLTK